MKKVVISVIIAVALLIGGYFAFRSETPLPAPVAIDTKNQPTLGNNKARVHIVAFEDLKCGNCMRFSTTLFPKIKQAYIDSGVAKFSFINLAFIHGSMPAANAARCVYNQNPKLFFDFVETIFQNQPPENEDWATVPFLLNTATKIPGVDQDKLGQCILRSPHDEFINNNMAQAMRIMNGAVATPTVYVNGVLVKPLTMKQLDAVIAAVKK